MLTGLTHYGRSRPGREILSRSCSPHDADCSDASLPNLPISHLIYSPPSSQTLLFMELRQQARLDVCTRRTAQLVPLIQDDALAVRNPPRLIQELERLVLSEFRFQLTMMRGRRDCWTQLYEPNKHLPVASAVLWIMELTGYGRMVSKCHSERGKLHLLLGFRQE